MAGRGRGALLRTALRQPGTKQKAADHPSQALQGLLKNLNLEADSGELDKIQKTAVAACINKNNLEETVNNIYQRCVRDWEFSKIGSQIAKRLANIEADGCKFRACLLSHIQGDYKKKEHLRNNNHQRYLGCVAFLCQVFGTLRTVAGDPMVALLDPVTSSILELIAIDAKDEEVDCGACQILAVGKVVEMADKAKMTNIMYAVRKRIISGRTPQKARCILLEVLEAYATGWEELPDDAVKFYSETLGDINAQRL